MVPKSPILIAAALLLTTLDSADAAELKVRITSYIANHRIKPVGDVEGHLAGPYLRRGLVFLETGEVGLFRSTGTIETTKGNGFVQSESTYSFDDGSTLVVSVDGDVEMSPGKGIIYRKLTGTSVRGSGRYEGISGTATATGRNLTPFSDETRSDAYFDAVITYTLPNK